MITQLKPILPVHTDMGDGYAHFLIDYSEEMHLYWVVCLDADGAFWTLPNPRVKMQKNITLGRTLNAG